MRLEHAAQTIWARLFMTQQVFWVEHMNVRVNITLRWQDNGLLVKGSCGDSVAGDTILRGTLTRHKLWLTVGWVTAQVYTMEALKSS